jgi:hypothetical protein
MFQLAKSGNFGMKLVHHALKAFFNVMLVNDFARVGQSRGTANASMTCGRRTYSQDFL